MREYRSESCAYVFKYLNDRRDEVSQFCLMARVHLDVLFPGKGDHISAMKFDTKHTRANILSQIAKQKGDPLIEHAKLILQKQNSEFVWMKKETNLKTLLAKNDMKLYVIPNPISIDFETLNGRTGKVTFNPKSPIRDTLSMFSEAVQLTNSLGYSIFPVVQGHEVLIDEALPLFIQTPSFDKIIYKIRYYNNQEEYGSGAIALYRTYCLTRDYLLTGFSLLPRKVYVKLCAEVCVIESGESINEDLAQVKTAKFASLLPIMFRKDDTVDELMQAIYKVQQNDVIEMRKEFVKHACGHELFGCQCFNATYNNEKVILCIGYKRAHIVKAGEFSSFETIDLTEATIQIENGNQVIIIESSVREDGVTVVEKSRVFVTDRCEEVRSLFTGYQNLRKNFERFNQSEMLACSEVEARPRSPRENTRPRSMTSTSIHVCELTSVVTPSIRGILALRQARTSKPELDRVELASASSLYLLASEVYPDMFGLGFERDSEKLREDGQMVYKTLVTAEKSLSLGMTLTELNEKYGNELRCVLYLLYELESKHVCKELRKKILSVYQRICSELNSKIVVSRVVDRKLERVVNPRTSLEKMMIAVPIVRKALPEIRKLEVIGKSKTHSQHLQELDRLLMNISEFFFDTVQKTDEIVFAKSRDTIVDFHCQVAKWIPVAATIDRIVQFGTSLSNELSLVLECLDSICIFSSLFPKVDFSALDLSCFSLTIGQGLMSLTEQVEKTTISQDMTVMHELLEKLRDNVPVVTSHFVPRETMKVLEDTLIQLQYHLGSYHSFFEKVGLRKDESMARSVILLSRWGLCRVSENLIYEDGQDITTKKKYKHPKRKTARIKAPEELSGEDLIELSHDMIHALELESSVEDCLEDSDEKVRDFLAEIEAKGISMLTLYETLRKWKPVLQNIDPECGNYEKAMEKYFICFDILHANLQRQSVFQPLSLLKKKLMYHANCITDADLETLKNDLIGLHEHLTEHTLPAKLEYLKSTVEKLIEQVESMESRTTTCESILTILMRLKDYFDSFVPGPFTCVDVLLDILTAMDEMKQIAIAIVLTQSNVRASRLVQILVVRFIQISELYIMIVKKLMDEDHKKRMHQKALRLYKCLEGLPSFLSERHLDKDGGKLMNALSNIRWKIFNYQCEDSLQARLDSISSDITTRISKLQECLDGKGLQTIMSSLDTLKEKIQAEEKSSTEILEAVRGLEELFEKKASLHVTEQLKLLVTVVSILIGQLENKPFLFVFHKSNAPSEKAEDTTRRHSFYAHQDLAAKARNVARGSKGIRDLVSRMSCGKLNSSQLKKRLSRPVRRPGILLGPKETVNRIPSGPHVTFDLSKDKSSSNQNNQENEVIPDDLLPVPVMTPCFESWRVQSYVHTLPFQDKDEEDEEKRVPCEPPAQCVTFKKLKIPAYKDQDVEPYESSAEAEREVDCVLTQIQNCLSRITNLNFVGSIGERVFWIYEWQEILAKVPSTLSAAKGFNLPETEQAKADYARVKEEVDRLIDEVQMSKAIHPNLMAYARHIEMLLNLLHYSLDAAGCEMMGTKASIYAIARIWMSRIQDAKELFSSLVLTHDTPAIIASRGIIEKVFELLLEFVRDAATIDTHTKREVLSMTENHARSSITKLLRKIKKCNVRDNPTIAQTSVLLNKLKGDKKFVSLDPRLKEICSDARKKMSQSVFSMSDADSISTRLKEVIETLEETRTQKNGKWILPLEGIRYTIMSLKFTHTLTNSDFVQLVEDVLNSLGTVNSTLQEKSEREGTMYVRNFCVPWVEFLTNVIKNLNSLKDVSDILYHGSPRYKVICDYVDEVSSVVVRLDARRFPFIAVHLFSQLSKVYQRLKDYVHCQLTETQAPFQDNSKLVQERIIEHLSDVFDFQHPQYNIDVVIPAKQSEIKYYQVLRKLIKMIQRQKYNSLTGVYSLNILICNTMLQLINGSVSEPQILSTLKSQSDPSPTTPVWRLEFDIMKRLFDVSTFLYHVTVENVKALLHEETDFEAVKDHYEKLGDGMKCERIDGLDSQGPVFISVLALLNSIKREYEIDPQLRQSLIDELAVKAELVPGPVDPGNLISAIAHLRYFFAHMFYADTFTQVHDRLFRFIQAERVFAALFMAIPNAGAIHSRLVKKLKHDLIGLVRNIGCLEFHVYWNMIVATLEQIAGIVQVIVGECREPTDSDKFEVLMEEMEKVIQALLQPKEEKKVVSNVFEGVAHVLLGIKHTPVLVFRLKLQVEEFRNFVLIARHLLFVDDVVEDLDLLFESVTPNFPDANGIRQAIASIKQGYQAQTDAKC